MKVFVAFFTVEGQNPYAMYLFKTNASAENYILSRDYEAFGKVFIPKNPDHRHLKAYVGEYPILD